MPENAVTRLIHRRVFGPGSRSRLVVDNGNPMESYVDHKKLFVPGVAKLYEALAPLSYTFVRFSLGVFLIPHGYAKLFQDDAIAASRNFVNFGWSHPLAWALLHRNA
jgi:hypothetical protein